MTLLEEGSVAEQPHFALPLVSGEQTPLGTPTGESWGGLDNGREPNGKAATQFAMGQLNVPRGKVCCVCKGTTSAAIIKCPLHCPRKFCSAGSYLAHRKTCSHADLDRLKILILSMQKILILILSRVPC